MKIVMPANVEPELFAKVCFVVTIFQKSYVFNIILWPDDAVYSDSNFCHVMPHYLCCALDLSFCLLLAML